MYNTATRVPSAVEGPLNGVWGRGNPAAPTWASVNPVATRAEVLQTVEWQNIFNIGNTRYSTSIYYQNLKDFIGWGGPYTNIGKFHGKGAEFSFKSIWSRELTLWGNAAYQDSRFHVTGNGTSFGNSVATDKGEMNSVPIVTMNAGVDWEFQEKMFVSPGIRYLTHQPTWKWTSSTDGHWGYSNNRAYVDLTFTFADFPKKNWDLSLQSFNIFNNTQTVAAQYLQGKTKELGTEVLLQVTHRF